MLTASMLAATVLFCRENYFKKIAETLPIFISIGCRVCSNTILTVHFLLLEIDEMAKLPQYPANRSEQTGLQIHEDSIRPKPNQSNARKTRNYFVLIRLAGHYTHEIEIELTPAELEHRDARTISRKVINAVAATSTICTVERTGYISRDQTIRDNWRHNALPEFFDL